MNADHTRIYRNLQTLMFLRALALSLLLGALLLIQFKEGESLFARIQSFHYTLVGAVYLLTILYVFLLRKFHNYRAQTQAQLLIDTLFVTALIYTTGGIESIFSSLYVLCIIAGSIILYRKGGMIVASACSILYGLLLDLQYYGFIHPLGSSYSYPGKYDGAYMLYTILVNIAAFYLVAYLASYGTELARQSRRELTLKQIALDKLEVLHESIVGSITSGLITLDSRNRIILMNPASEEIFGFRSKDVSGKKAGDFLPFLKEFLESDSSPLIWGAERLQPFLDVSYTRKGGEKIYLRLFISPLRLPRGDKNGCILTFQDLTAVKKIESEMEKVENMALIGQLAAGIAHEIRNPMASISGSIQVLKNGLEPNDFNTRLMDIVCREIDRLNNLINDFLNFARPRETKTGQFEINKLISEALELFRNSMHCTKKTEILTHFSRPIMMESDPEMLKQVFWNLFLNASDAMVETGTLTVSTEIIEDGLEKSRDTAKIVVRDTGPGFDGEALEKIFTPFYTTKEGGSGLGLATVKRIINGLNGKISGGNSAEGGAEITVLLPLSAVEATGGDND